MAPEFLSCPLCGFEFEKADTLCDHGCPLGKMCHLIRCPSCAYEFPEAQEPISWIKKMFGHKSAAVLDPPDVRRLSELDSGDTAIVMCVGRSGDSRHNTLAVFGLVPETEITLLQQNPSCVIQVGETQLALDKEIAADILVR